MYLSLDGKAYYDDTDEEQEDRKTIPARCSWCGGPVQAWFAGISHYSTEPYYRGYCERCGCTVRART